MSNILKTIISIVDVTSVSLVYFIVKFLERKGVGQNSKLIFIGDQQLRFVYILLGISLFASLVLLINYLNIFTVTVNILLLVIFFLIKLKHLKISLVTIAISFMAMLLGENQQLIPSQEWYTITLFVLSIFNLFIVLSILSDKSFLKKPWNEVELFLRQKGYKDDAVQKFYIQWQKNQ